MATNKPNQIPERIWRAILKEAAKGVSYAELARKWGPKVEREFGLALGATKIARKVRSSGTDAPPLDSQALLALADSFWANLSPEERASLPTDGAEQHDHCAWGLPKSGQ